MFSAAAIVVAVIRRAGRPSSRIALPVAAGLSANREVDHDRDEHIDRSAGKTSRLESPLGNGPHGFFIETGAI
jgi:hypothetical protein